eukprot:g60552.t1
MRRIPTRPPASSYFIPLVWDPTKRSHRRLICPHREAHTSRIGDVYEAVSALAQPCLCPLTCTKLNILRKY